MLTDPRPGCRRISEEKGRVFDEWRGEEPVPFI